MLPARDMGRSDEAPHEGVGDQAEKRLEFRAAGRLWSAADGRRRSSDRWQTRGAAAGGLSSPVAMPDRRSSRSVRLRHTSSATREEMILGGGGWKKLFRGLGARTIDSRAMVAPIPRLDIMRADRFER